MKRIFVLFLFFVGLNSPIFSNSYFDGEGTKDSPFLIKNANNLRELSLLVRSGISFKGLYLELADSIDMTNIYFEPIGLDQLYPFSGTFDGKGLPIKNLYVKSTYYVGLFGYIKDAFINNVCIKGADLTGDIRIGGIVGHCESSTIINSSTHGFISGNGFVGAIAGLNDENSIIQNCFSSIQLTKQEVDYGIGGLVGYNSGKIENCYFSGVINANTYNPDNVGGVVGYNHTTSTINNCYFLQTQDTNNLFDYCGNLNWGVCRYVGAFDSHGFTSDGCYLHELLNSWVINHNIQNEYKIWTTEAFPKLSENTSLTPDNFKPEFVDLGLPSRRLWATVNIGATRPNEFGWYFAWGETSPKEVYSWETYKYSDGDSDKITKYTKPGMTLEACDDAATANWGEDWRMPTVNEMNELRNFCTWIFTEQNGTQGYIIKGTNDNQIFLPLAGMKNYSHHVNPTQGRYWTSSIAYNNNTYASYLLFDETEYDWYMVNRNYGHSVRAVYQGNTNRIEDLTETTTDSVVFDLFGRKLKVESISEIPQGFFIVNGRKVVIK